MKIIRFVKDKQTIMYPGDTWRLIQVAVKKGYILSVDDAEAAWVEHSCSFHAGWLTMSDKTDDELWNSISSYLVEESS